MKFIIGIFFSTVYLSAGCFLKPSEPFCVNFEFRSKSNFDYCKRQVENYLEDVSKYISCMKDEANEVIKKFNCRVNGDSYCF